MSEQILSQEEIDALLGAMAKGEVDLEEESAEENKVEVYDLVGSSTGIKEEFNSLNQVHSKFSELLRPRMTGDLQTQVEVLFTSAEIIKFSEFIRAFAPPASLNIFAMDPLIGSGVLACDSSFVFSLIDCMFGGKGKSLNQVRDFTPIERRMMERFASGVLEEFEKAWATVYSVNISLKKVEYKPEFLHIASPNDMVLVTMFSIEAGEFSGNLTFCLPYLMLEPIKDKLTITYQREKDTGYAWRSQLERLLKDTHLSIKAELGRSFFSVRDILKFQPDDVLNLNTGPDDFVTMTVAGVPKFFGVPGIIKGNRAVEVTRLILDEREED
jgi:flagellar motor switch protein FliM